MRFCIRGGDIIGLPSPSESPDKNCEGQDENGNDTHPIATVRKPRKNGVHPLVLSFLAEVRNNLLGVQSVIGRSSK